MFLLHCVSFSSSTSFLLTFLWDDRSSQHHTNDIHISHFLPRNGLASWQFVGGGAMILPVAVQYLFEVLWFDLLLEWKFFDIDTTSELGYVAEHFLASPVVTFYAEECCHGSTADAVQKPEAT